MGELETRPETRPGARPPDITFPDPIEEWLNAPLPETIDRKASVREQLVNLSHHIHESLGVQGPPEPVAPPSVPRHMWRAEKIGAGEALAKKGVLGRLPVMGEAFQFARLWKVNKLARKLQDDPDAAELKGPERRAALKYVAEFITEAEEEKARGTTFGADVSGILADMVPFAAEIMLSAGASGAVKRGLRGWISRRVGKGLAARGAATLAGGVAAGLLRAGTVGAHRVAGEYARRRMPHLVMTPENEVEVAAEGEAPLTAFLKSFGDVVVEYASEETGEYLGRAFGSAVRSVKGGRGFARRFVRAFARGTGQTEKSVARRLLTRAGYHGMLEEFGEERVGDMMRVALGVEDRNLENLKRALWPGWRQAGTELVAFAIPGVAAAAAERMVRKDPDKAIELARKRTLTFADLKPYGFEGATAVERDQVLAALREQLGEGLKVVPERGRIAGEVLEARRAARPHRGVPAEELAELREKVNEEQRAEIDSELERREAEERFERAWRGGVRERPAARREARPEVPLEARAEVPTEAPAEPPPETAKPPAPGAQVVVEGKAVHVPVTYRQSPGAKASREKTVEIDVRRLDEAWQAEGLGYSLGRGEGWHPGRTEATREYLSEMPRFGIAAGDKPHFTEGRHRFAILRDAGVEAIPVSVDAPQAERVKALWGVRAEAETRSREELLKLPNRELEGILRERGEKHYGGLKKTRLVERILAPAEAEAAPPAAEPEAPAAPEAATAAETRETAETREVLGRTYASEKGRHRAAVKKARAEHAKLLEAGDELALSLPPVEDLLEDTPRAERFWQVAEKTDALDPFKEKVAGLKGRLDAVAEQRERMRAAGEAVRGPRPEPAPEAVERGRKGAETRRRRKLEGELEGELTAAMREFKDLQARAKKAKGEQQQSLRDEAMRVFDGIERMQEAREAGRFERRDWDPEAARREEAEEAEAEVEETLTAETARLAEADPSRAAELAGVQPAPGVTRSAMHMAPGPADAAEDLGRAARAGSVAGYVSQPAETASGRRLLKRLQADARRAGKGKPARVGLRSITENLLRALYAKLHVGRLQTTATSSAVYQNPHHMVFSRSGAWQANFHEAGHALSSYVRDQDAGWDNGFSQSLSALTRMQGSIASAGTAEEGLGEFARRYVVDPASLPPGLVKGIEAALAEHAPEALAALRDTHRAYAFQRSRPVEEQMASLTNDRGPKLGRAEAARTALLKIGAAVFGSDVISHGLRRKAWRAIRKKGLKDAPAHVRLFAALLGWAPGAPLLSRTMRRVDAAARQFDKDYGRRMAGELTMRQHVPAEVQRVLYGAAGGAREGVRIAVPERGLKLTGDDVATLRKAGFTVPELVPGEWAWLGDVTLDRVRRRVGERNWDAFTHYGQRKASLERYREDNQLYPGLADGLTPEVLEEWLREQERRHPTWSERADEVRAIADQCLLVAVLGGEYSAGEAATIKRKWQDYWPLPRQVEDRSTSRGPGGATPDSGVRACYGSMLPFKTIEEAIEMRLKKALGAFYENQTMLGLRDFGLALEREAADLGLRKQLVRIMTPLARTTKKVATLQENELKEIAADLMNRRRAKELGVGLERLPIEEFTTKGDIDVAFPGRPVWRSDKPKAARLVAPYENGRRMFYMVDNAAVYDMLAQGTTNRTVKLVSEFFRSAWAPLRGWLTENLAFGIFNAGFRDPAMAFFKGDSWKHMIPFYRTAVLTREYVTGESSTAADGELLSQCMEYCTAKPHRTRWQSFKDLMRENVVPEGYGDMSGWDKAAHAPGQVLAAIGKPLDVVNWLTGGRWLSQFGEKATRRAAHVVARRQGYSVQRAQREYDKITGNFGDRSIYPNVAAVFRLFGFLNAGLRIQWAIAESFTDPDPRRRAAAFAKWGLLAGRGAAFAALNVLLIHALYPDDDEREELLEDMRERPVHDRVGYRLIGGVLRAPFDYGVLGAVESYGWNAAEAELLEAPLDSKKAAEKLLARARDLPGLTDILPPHAQLHLELMSNYSYFWNEEIVPAWLEAAHKWAPEKQTWPDMPETFNAIGRGLGVSPIKVRYALRSLFTRHVTDTVHFIDKVKKGTVEGLADVPVIARLFPREPRGYRSESVRSLGELDREYERLKEALVEIGREGGDEARRREIEPRVKELARVHKVMLRVRKIGKKVRAETRKRKPDQALIRRLEKEMTRIARELLQTAPGRPTASGAATRPAAQPR